MDILHLTYFLAVATHKSFTKASQALHISQPSISKNIRNLEKEWGITLFVRNARSIELTEAGQAILPKVKSIVSQFQKLEEQIHSGDTWQNGHITFGIPPMASSTFLPPLIAEFNKIHPHISIAIEERNSLQIAKSVNDGSLHVGCVALPISELPPNNYIFHDEPLKVLLPKGHHLAQAKSLTLEDLKDETFAFFSPKFSLYKTIMNSFQSFGIQPNIICKSSNASFISEMVYSKVGIALLPESICRKLEVEKFEIVDLNLPVSWRLALVWSNNIFLTSPTMVWIKFLQEKLKQIPADKLYTL